MLCAWETYLLKTKGLAITHSPSERSYRQPMDKMVVSMDTNNHEGSCVHFQTKGPCQYILPLF